MNAVVFAMEPHRAVQAPHLRCTLKRALAVRPAENVWTSTEHINDALVMAYGDQLPDFGKWVLTSSQLYTLKLAIEWRRAKRAASDKRTAVDILEHWREIEDEVLTAYAVANEAGL